MTQNSLFLSPQILQCTQRMSHGKWIAWKSSFVFLHLLNDTFSSCFITVYNHGISLFNRKRSYQVCHFLASLAHMATFKTLRVFILPTMHLLTLFFFRCRDIPRAWYFLITNTLTHHLRWHGNDNGYGRHSRCPYPPFHNFYGLEIHFFILLLSRCPIYPLFISKSLGGKDSIMSWRIVLSSAKKLDFWNSFVTITKCLMLNVERRSNCTLHYQIGWQEA